MLKLNLCYNKTVSTGVGTSILPLRFNCPPEIVVIKFEKKKPFGQIL
ncbi:hypothetical protein J6A34_01820 [bacterium]|nr:hypothetical protein [bacterium]